MTRKITIIFALLFAAGLVSGYAQSSAISKAELIKTGIAFYSEGKYTEASGILRLAGGEPEALYWLSLAELSAGNYDIALSCMDTLEEADSGGRWSADIPYHRGRCLYYLGRHDEAIDSLSRYTETLDDSDPRKASSYYWQGESLLASGQLDGAADAFSAVVEHYPHSAKYEASYYRLNLINQKKIEAELLGMLKWSHEESLKSIEEYEEREKNYEAAIAEYQRRIGELLALEASKTPDPADSSAGFTFPEAGIIEPRLEHAGHFSETERSVRIRELTTSARELADALNNMLGGAE